ncbi:MAG: DUF2442 domain-containing protein [Deinococcota bacterium]
MNSSTLGKNTSNIEVTHISAHGVWLLANDKELFMPYDDFPWFKEAKVREILNVQQVSESHFYWPDLDVDLSEDIIRHPEHFPKVSKL